MITSGDPIGSATPPADSSGDASRSPSESAELAGGLHLLSASEHEAVTATILDAAVVLDPELLRRTCLAARDDESDPLRSCLPGHDPSAKET